MPGEIKSDIIIVININILVIKMAFGYSFVLSKLEALLELVLSKNL